MPFFIIMYLIVIHECGHFFTALILNIKVNKICIYPFGGISKFDLDLNISQIKELIILIMGPVMQYLGYLFLINNSFMSNYTSLISIYNYGILFFNLLPIYPLDGGKIVNILLSYKLSFKKSLFISIIVSYFCVLVLFLILFKYININIVVIICFLLYKIISEYRRIDYYYQKFLLERYLNKYYFKKEIIVNNPQEFHRNYRHLIKNNGYYYTEKEILEKIYKRY